MTEKNLLKGVIALASMGNKARIVFVLHLLERYTDRDTPILAENLLELLKDEGIVCERKALYDDIGILRGMGYDIRTVRGKKRGYCLASRDFEMDEICLVVNAVRTSGFLPESKMKGLTKRLSNLLSDRQAEQVGKSACIVNNKCVNEETFNIVNGINLAIAQNKKVKLNYRRNSLDGRSLEFKYKTMKVSPYALLRDNEHYYLVCNNEKYDNLMNLRVDRIEQLTATDEKSRHFSEVSEYKQYFDIADYAKKTFNMFDGEPCRIDLECNVKLLDQMIDRFGKDIFIRRDDHSELFRFSTDALISDGFIGWLMQFGGDVKVLSPKSLKEDVKKRAHALCDALE